MIRSVPGMTEVGLGGDAVLGLMLATAIHRLFGERLPDLGAGAVVRSELYLYVAAPEAYLQRAFAARRPARRRTARTRLGRSCRLRAGSRRPPAGLRREIGGVTVPGQFRFFMSGLLIAYRTGLQAQALLTSGVTSHARMASTQIGRTADLHGEAARRVRAMAEKCSCIFAIPAIHGGQMARMNPTHSAIQMRSLAAVAERQHIKFSLFIVKLDGRA
jgi:hypothetical protein